MPQPHRGLIISHPAGGLFYIWLQMKNRIPVTRQSLFRQPVQLPQQEGTRLSFRTWQYFRVQLLEKPGISGKKSPVQQCQVKFRVVLFNPLALLDRAAGRADSESQVP